MSVEMFKMCAHAVCRSFVGSDLAMAFRTTLDLIGVQSQCLVNGDSDPILPDLHFAGVDFHRLPLQH